MVGIYCIRNLINNKRYIGQSIDIQRRWKDHRIASQTTDNVLYRAIRKYGLDNFEFSVIEECAIIELDEKEEFYIQQYNTVIPYGYNMSLGGQPQRHFLKLDAERLAQLKIELRDTDIPIKQLAQKYDISHQVVYDINNGKIWRQDNEYYPIRNLTDATIIHIFDEESQTMKSYRSCIDCGVLISLCSTRCVDCNALYRRHQERPSADDLVAMIATTGFTAVGEKYGVSSNTIRRWCNGYDLPNTIKPIKELYLQMHPELNIKRKVTITTQSKTKKRHVVVQKDLQTGTVINTYASCIEAARILGDANYNKHISSAASGSRRSAYGFVWEYKEVD